MRYRRPTVMLLAAGLAGALVVPAAQASDPSSSEVTAPQSRTETVEATWTGTIPPGSGEGFANCKDGLNDVHEVTINVPAGSYDDFEVVALFTVDPDATTDAMISVEQPNGEVLHTDGPFVDGAESISIMNPPPGLYTVYACPYSAVDPSNVYAGSITLTVPPDPITGPLADAQGLQFSASTVADIQRDEAEPMVHISLDGVAYTCGPTGTSQANEYAQVSTDGGDQFHLLGEPPRGQLSQGGGGDCAIDTGLEPNEQGNYQMAYTGLSSLITFTTATSPDNGATITSSPFSSSYPVVDRQWVALTGDLTTFHAYNKLALGIHVQKSEDGGLTYDPDTLISPGALRGPGDITAMPGSLNPASDDPVIFYPWQLDNNVMMALSLDNGQTWNNCRIFAASSNPGRLFPGLDNDNQGNLYAVWTEEANDDTFINVLRNEDLVNCTGGIENVDKSFLVDPGFSRAVKVNRGEIDTTVFPWIAAGGAPGRVAVTFFGTPDGEHPDAANEKTWHVYVNQTLNALDAFNDGPVDFSQVQATTHPPHYGSICLGGLGCNLSVPEGDRSMADFYAMDLDPVSGELMVVFNRTHKRPTDTLGQIATPVVVRQIAGPSNLGGTVSVPDRTPLRNFSTDPAGDAIADYSSQFTPPRQAVIPAADITSVKVGPAVDPETGEAITENAGFTVTATFDDLSDSALQSALQEAQTQSIMYIFRFVDGFRYSAAVASWSLAGWQFGFNEFAGAPTECPADQNLGQIAGEDGCLKYPADKPLDMAKVEGNTITMTVPLEYLEALEPGDPVPTERAAKAGDRIYTAAMYTQGNTTSPVPQVQSWLEPYDNSPAFDFILGASTPDGSPGQAPEPDPGTAPDDDTPTTPVTGGGAALLGLLIAGGALALRRRSTPTA